MACGCGGECCKQPKGLGFLYLESGGGYGDSWGEDWWNGGSGGEGDWYLGGGGGDDFWGFSDPYWGGDYYDPASNTFRFFDSDSFLPSNTGTSGGGGWNWQGLLDWWNDLTGGVTGDVGGGGGTNPPLLPYCPGGTYHPLNDPYSCVPFPPETPEFEKQQRAAAAQKAAQDALKARAAQQQRQQGCPPNTGLVKNVQGQCVCPPGYAPNAELKKCVLVNASLAAQSQQAPDWLKYALLALGAVVVVKAVKK